MTDMRVTRRHRGKLQPAEAFVLQGSIDPLKPGLLQEPGFLFGSCASDGCPFGCARAQAPADPVCMCAQARSADGAGMQRSRQAHLPGSRADTAERASPRELSGAERRPTKPEAGGSTPPRGTRFLSRWTSGEVLGPSRRRGGFDSHTGCQSRSLSSSSRFDRRKPAATIGRRRNPSPTTLQGIERVPVCSATRKRICFGSRGLQVRVLPHGPGIADQQYTSP